MLSGAIEKKPAPGDHEPHLKKWDLPLTAIGCIKEEIQFFLLHGLDVELILEFKHNFGKYHPVFPKNP